MVVASKSAVSRRRQVPVRLPLTPSTTIEDRARAKSQLSLIGSLKSSGKTVTVLHSSQTTPLWLLRLGACQRGISVMTFTLVMAALATYGWTVYFQHNWNEAYRKLILLQRNERQLTTESEELKHHIAGQAEKPEMGLTPPDPAQVIFLPESEGSTIAVPPTKPSNQTQQLIPMGY